MSVPSEARGPQKFDALIGLRQFLKEFLISLQNNKVFRREKTGNDEYDSKNPPQPELVTKLRKTAIDMYIAAFSANEVILNKNNYRHRRQLQDKSIALHNELLALIELCIPIFHLPLRRVENWTKKIVYSRNKIQKWKESDYRRYKKL